MSSEDGMTLSETKFNVNNWLLDELGLDADQYTDMIDSAVNIKDVSSAALTIYSKLQSIDRSLAKKFFDYWTSINKH